MFVQHRFSCMTPGAQGYQTFRKCIPSNPLFLKINIVAYLISTSGMQHCTVSSRDSLAAQRSPYQRSSAMSSALRPLHDLNLGSNRGPGLFLVLSCSSTLFCNVLTCGVMLDKTYIVHQERQSMAKVAIILPGLSFTLVSGVPHSMPTEDPLRICTSIDSVGCPLLILSESYLLIWYILWYILKYFK